MANVRIPAALARALRELARARAQLAYSGVDQKHAMDVERLTDNIMETAAHICEAARAAQGFRDRHTVRRVRRVLGYTYP